MIATLLLVHTPILVGCSDDDDDATTGNESGGTLTTTSTSSGTGSETSSSSSSTTDPTADPTETDTENLSSSESTGETLLELGEPCMGSDECASGHCYQLGGMGACSECQTDADCESGGCSPPNIFVMPYTAGFCNAGELGDPCNSDEACVDGTSCIEVVDNPEAGLVLSTCGECASDEDCDDDASCTPQYDLTNFRGQYSCIALGTVENGGGCTPGNDAQCASEMCVETSIFLGALTLGVCGTCKTNDDCEVEGETCLTPSITSTFEIVAPACGVAETED